MSHTTFSPDRKAWVIHNSDWSGPSELCWLDKFGNETRVTIPRELIAIIRNAALDDASDGVLNLIEGPPRDEHDRAMSMAINAIRALKAKP